MPTTMTSAERVRRLRTFDPKPEFEECGCCGHVHRVGWTGDCRDDSERFTFEELDEGFGEGAHDVRMIDDAEG